MEKFWNDAAAKVFELHQAGEKDPITKACGEVNPQLKAALQVMVFKTYGVEI